jgi:hypothetical protein
MAPRGNWGRQQDAGIERRLQEQAAVDRAKSETGKSADPGSKSTRRRYRPMGGKKGAGNYDRADDYAVETKLEAQAKTDQSNASKSTGSSGKSSAPAKSKRRKRP